MVKRLKNINIKYIFIINIFLLLHLNIKSENLEKITPDNVLIKNQTNNELLTKENTNQINIKSKDTKEDLLNIKDEKKIDISNIQEETKITTKEESKITGKEELEEKEEIYLNFENTSLSSVVNYLSEQKKINIIPRSELEGIKVTLTTRNALTIKKAWDILLTLLDLNNFTIINVNNLYRIVPKAEGQRNPLPTYSSATGTDPEDLPNNDLIVRYVYFLKNIKAETVLKFLKSMLGGIIQINKDLDACIVTEKCLNIKSAMKIIKELDQGGLRESIKIIPLKYTNAEEVSLLFGEIIKTKDDQSQRTIRFMGPGENKPATYFSSNTKIITETRNNSLILLGTEKNLIKIIDFIYKYIDIPIKEAKSRLHVKEIKYSKAENLKPIIENIVKNPSGSDKKLQVGDYKFFEDVIIATDSSAAGDNVGGNRLIIACNTEDWVRINAFIDKLDKPQPQIAFEVMIVDVSIQTNNELWSQFKPKGEPLGKNIGMMFRNSVENSKMDTGVPILQTGIIGTNMTFGKTENFWASIKAILRKNNYNIITQPFIVTNNYQKCVVDSTELRQVAGEFKTQVGVQVSRPKVEKTAKTTVTLTPKVNLEGIVDLQIDVDISDFQSTIQTDPNTTTRNLTTKVSMGTGEVLILGGLTKSELGEKHYKTPILGDIPILGNFFKTKKKEKEKTNLFIFIRPSIIKPRFDGRPDEYTILKLDYAKYQMLNVDTYAKDKDPIQRWFFKPRHQTIKQKLSDARKGAFSPIDNYTYGFRQPKSVDIKRDPYYRGSEGIEEQKEKFKSFENKKTLSLNKNHKKLKTRRQIKKPY